MMFDWITTEQAASKWGIKERQVQALCVKGKIKNAIKISKIWLIPKNAEKPIDGRTKEAKFRKS